MASFFLCETLIAWFNSSDVKPGLQSLHFVSLESGSGHIQLEKNIDSEWLLEWLLEELELISMKSGRLNCTLL